jgi:branched-chain amino acid transport system substrate-binding protein
MRMGALMSVLREDKAVRSVYLLNPDYSFGQAVQREARRQLAAQRPDVQVVGEELHPLLRIKDFAPYATKIKASGADAVITGNFSNDLTLLVKAAREVGFEGASTPSTATRWARRPRSARPASARCWRWPTGCPTCPRAERGLLPVLPPALSRAADDYVHMRMQLMIEALAQAIEQAGTAEAVPLAQALEQAQVASPARRDACARPTTSSSSRWWWA